MNDFSNLPITGGVGFFAAIFGAAATFFGLKGRVGRLEKSSDDAHERIDDVIKGLPLNFVGAAHHTTCQGATVRSLKDLGDRMGKLEDQNIEQTGLLHEIKGKLEDKNG